MRKPRRRPPRGLRRLLGGALLIASSLFALPATALAAEAGLSCKTPYATDYAAPLATMPGAHPVPEELPFGPRNFSVQAVGRTHVALLGENYGFNFAAKNAPYRVLELGWHVTATASAVDRQGRVLRQVGERGWTVDKTKEVSKLRLAFAARHAGFVRVDLRITTLAGRKLGSYRDYFRVLKPSTDVRIGLDRTTVAPGQTVIGRLENPGAGNVSGRQSALEVERFTGSGWEAIAQPPNPETIAGYGWFMGPGEAWRCYGWTVPADATPGRYRFSDSVYIAAGRRHETLTSDFQVAPLAG